MTQGIYRIINTATGTIYIGSSRNIEQRWEQHWRDLGRGNHANWRLQSDYNKYGRQIFRAEKVEQIELPSNLIPREGYWLNKQIADGGAISVYNTRLENTQGIVPVPVYKPRKWPRERAYTLKKNWIIAAVIFTFFLPGCLGALTMLASVEVAVAIGWESSETPDAESAFAVVGVIVYLLACLAIPIFTILLWFLWQKPRLKPEDFERPPKPDPITRY